MVNSPFFNSLFRKKSADEVHDDERESLKRTLTVWDLTAFGIAAVIGAGIFSTIGTAAFDGGPGVVWLFVATAIVCGLSTACYAEFASKVPAAGSAYTYAFVSLGELLAWIIGWDLIMEYAIGNIAVAISWSGYFTALLDGYGLHIPRFLTQDYVSALHGFETVSKLLEQGQKLPEALGQAGGAAADGYSAWISAPHLGSLTFVCNLPALAVVVFITWLAYVGMKESKWAANGMVILKVAIILLVIAVGSFFIRPTHWIPFLPNGMSGVLKGVSAVFFAYIGFDAISTMAEECDNPQRDLPRGMFWALGICTVLYSAIALVITGIVSYKSLAVSDPLAYVFGPHGANIGWMSAIVALSAVVAMTSVLLVFQVGQPRIWMAMSRDGLLPKIFSAIHPKYRTPWFSTIVTGIMVGLPALFMNLVEVTDLTSIGTLFAFVLVCAGVIRLHEQRKLNLSKGIVSARVDGRKTFELPIISARYWFPLICVLLLILRAIFGHGGMIDFFNFNSATQPGVFDWNTTKEKIPLLGYLLLMLYLNFLCVKDDLSLIPVLGLASCGYLMTELGWTNWARFIIWLTIGLFIYFGYSRSRSYLQKAQNSRPKLG
jgi:amino acid transporter